MCHNYTTTGHCPYESRCRFIHEQNEELSNPFVLRDESQPGRRNARSHRRVRSASMYVHREQQPVRDTESAAQSLILNSTDWQPSDFLPEIEIREPVDQNFVPSLDMGGALEMSETINQLVNTALDTPPNEQQHRQNRQNRHSEPDISHAVADYKYRLNRLVLSPRRGEGRLRIDLSPRRGEGRLHGPKSNSKSATLYPADAWSTSPTPRRQSHSMNSIKPKKLKSYATLPPRFFDNMDSEARRSMETDARRSFELEGSRRSGSLSYEYTSSTDISPATSAVSSGISDSHSYFRSTSESEIEQQFHSMSLKKSLFEHPPPPQRAAPMSAPMFHNHNRSATLPFIDSEDMGGAPPAWQLWSN